MKNKLNENTLWLDTTPKWIQNYKGYLNLSKAKQKILVNLTKKDFKIKLKQNNGKITYT